MKELWYINENKPAIPKYIIKLLRGDICFISYLTEEPSKTPSHKQSVFPNEENKNTMLASSPTKTHVPEGLTSERESTSNLYKQPVNEKVNHTTGYEKSVQHIAKHKENGIRCHINADFARGRAQTNAANT